MKKLFSLLSIVCIIAISNCTSIPENNDPILGTWVKATTTLESKNETSVREEWIFNDVNLGRYQRFSNNTIDFYTDFRWSEDDGIYNIIDSDTEISDVIVNLEETNEPEILSLENGGVFAVRE